MSEKSQQMQDILARGRAAAAPEPVPAEDPTAGRSVNWRGLGDLQAPAEWKALRNFVEWLTVRYEISSSIVPDCWWQHAALVEELSALHTAHLVAFDPKDTGYGPITWHERLATTTQRMRTAYHGGCSRGHSPLKPRTWSDSTDEAAWDAWITQTHAR